MAVSPRDSVMPPCLCVELGLALIDHSVHPGDFVLRTTSKSDSTGLAYRQVIHKNTGPQCDPLAQVAELADALG